MLTLKCSELDRIIRPRCTSPMWSASPHSSGVKKTASFCRVFCCCCLERLWLELSLFICRLSLSTPAFTPRSRPSSSRCSSGERMIYWLNELLYQSAGAEGRTSASSAYVINILLYKCQLYHFTHRHFPHCWLHYPVMEGLTSSSGSLSPSLLLFHTCRLAPSLSFSLFPSIPLSASLALPTVVCQ